jgi:hypothetical protein
MVRPVLENKIPVELVVTAALTVVAVTLFFRIAIVEVSAEPKVPSFATNRYDLVMVPP